MMERVLNKMEEYREKYDANEEFRNSKTSEQAKQMGVSQATMSVWRSKLGISKGRGGGKETSEDREERAENVANLEAPTFRNLMRKIKELDAFAIEVMKLQHEKAKELFLS